MSILIVDDEEWNISKLQDVLRVRTRGTRVDYTSSVDDAIALMREHQQEPYKALVTDFNMDGLNGKQLIRLATGQHSDRRIKRFTIEELTDYDAEVAEAVQEHFGTTGTYWKFLDAYSDMRYVLFSSRPFGDNRRESLLENVLVEIKNNENPDDYTAENRIVDYLIAENCVRARR